jgi:hypothetical protein
VSVYRGPSIDAFCQVSVHLAKQFSEEKIFLEINQSETRIASGGHVCFTDQEEKSNLYREPSIDASY